MFPETLASSLRVSETSLHSFQEPVTQVRRLFIALCVVGAVLLYVDRANPAVAIIPMTIEFGWSDSERGTILSSFFYGYIFTQILSGWAADIFGGVLLVFGGFFCACVGILLVPFAAAHGVWWLAVCRGFTGFCAGFVFPVFHSMLCRWIPPSERPLSLGILLFSVQGGVVLANFYASLLLSTHFGWRAIFYILGAVGLLWSVAWLFLMTNTPREHRWVSQGEADHIEKTIKRQDGTASVVFSFEQLCTQSKLHLAPVIPPRAIPWRAILTNQMFWVVLITQSANSWGLYVFQQWLPTYYCASFRTTPRETALSVIIPYSLQGCLVLALSLLSSRLSVPAAQKQSVRRVSQGIAMGVPAACLTVIVLAHRSYTVSLLFFSFGIMFNSFSILGAQMAHFDLGPHYAGVLYGLISTASIFAGSAGVKLSGFLLELSGDWQLVWAACIFNYIVGASIWCLLYKPELSFQ